LGDIFSGRTGMMSGGVRLRAALAFDIAAAVPPGSTVTSASLTLLMVQSNSGPQMHTLRTLTQDWGEGTSWAFGGEGARATPGDVTWMHTFYPDQMWSNPGGDFSPVISASQVVDLVAFYTWASPQMAADVQGWLDDPCSNFGWIVIGNESALMTSKKFASREYKVVEDRPRLDIEYTPPATPACVADIAPAPAGDDTVDVNDLLAVIADWGPCPEQGCCPADIAPQLGGDSEVNVDDLLAVIGAWGPCEE
jgi:hypothetical protein